jgi:hypothetical protein
MLFWDSILRKKNIISRCLELSKQVVEVVTYSTQLQNFKWIVKWMFYWMIKWALKFMIMKKT